MIATSKRPATPADVEFVRSMTFQALFVPPGSDPFEVDMVDAEGIAHYHRGFGTRPGDIGIIAEDRGGRPIGAAWVRRFDGADPGYGFVDEHTPELTIATIAERRGEGAGSAMLGELLASLDRCSLSVHRLNPALRLYERAGFELWSIDGDSGTMLWLRQ